MLEGDVYSINPERNLILVGDGEKYFVSVSPTLLSKKKFKDVLLLETKDLPTAQHFYDQIKAAYETLIY